MTTDLFSFVLRSGVRSAAQRDEKFSGNSGPEWLNWLPGPCSVHSIVCVTQSALWICAYVVSVCCVYALFFCKFKTQRCMIASLAMH